MRPHNYLFEVDIATSYCSRLTIASEFVTLHREKGVHVQDRIDHKLSLLKT